MNTIEIAGRTYEVHPCWCDNGKAYDATNADKVATGGKATATCSHCRGRGETYRLPAPVDKVVTSQPEPVGDIPDWML